jgi:hypothetical protein
MRYSRSECQDLLEIPSFGALRLGLVVPSANAAVDVSNTGWGFEEGPLFGLVVCSGSRADDVAAAGLVFEVEPRFGLARESLCGEASAVSQLTGKVRA